VKSASELRRPLGGGELAENADEMNGFEFRACHCAPGPFFEEAPELRWVKSASELRRPRGGGELGENADELSGFRACRCAPGPFFEEAPQLRQVKSASELCRVRNEGELGANSHELDSFLVCPRVVEAAPGKVKLASELRRVPIEGVLAPCVGPCFEASSGLKLCSFLVVSSQRDATFFTGIGVPF